MKISTTSDKIILGAGEKNVSVLSGKKYTEDLSGDADKNKTVTGEKYLLDFNVLKDIIAFSARTQLDDLEGEKNIDTLLGEKDAYPILIGSAEEGYWHIRIDTTYFYADDTITTCDRN